MLVSIGGVRTRAVCNSVLNMSRPRCSARFARRCIPDRQSHQFYPTPESVARAASELAAIGEGDQVLEPSAGHGDLAAFLPVDAYAVRGGIRVALQRIEGAGF